MRGGGQVEKEVWKTVQMPKNVANQDAWEDERKPDGRERGAKRRERTVFVIVLEFSEFCRP